VPETERLPLLAYLEQRAKQEADFLALRAMKDWRNNRSSQTWTPPPRAG
jgi:hypothetical protein